MFTINVYHHHTFEPSPDLLARLTALEAGQTALSTRMSAETDKLAELGTHVADLVTFVTDLKGQLATLKANVGNDPAVISGIETIEKQIDDLKAAPPAEPPAGS